MLESECESSLLESTVRPAATCEDCRDVSACDEPLGSVVAGAPIVKVDGFALRFRLIATYPYCFRF